MKISLGKGHFGKRPYTTPTVCKTSQKFSSLLSLLIIPLSRHISLPLLKAPTCFCTSSLLLCFPHFDPNLSPLFVFISLTLWPIDTLIWYKIVKTPKGSNNVSFAHLYSLLSRYPKATTVTKDILFIHGTQAAIHAHTHTEGRGEDEFFFKTTAFCFSIHKTWRMCPIATWKMTLPSVTLHCFPLSGSTIISLTPYGKTFELLQHFIIINNHI